VDEPLLGEIAHHTREVALATVEFRREVGDRVTSFDGGEHLEADTTEHCVT
jgi:hypothetical protein